MTKRQTGCKFAVGACTALTLLSLLFFPVAPTQAESIGLNANYWKVANQTTFAEGTAAQKISGGVINAGAVLPLLPGFTGIVDYGLGRGLAGQQGDQTFTVDASRILVGASYALLRQEQLELGPMVGYLRATNRFTWGAGAEATQYNVDSSGFVVGARAVAAPLPALTVEGQVLYGPRVSVSDTSGPASRTYDSTYIDVKGRVAYEVWSNVQVEAGYQRLIQTAGQPDAQLWRQDSGGLFAGVRVTF